MAQAEIKRIKLPKPLAHQAPILLDDHRFKVVDAGRRFGKTTMGLIACVYGHGPKMPAGSSTQFKYPGALDGATIWWVGPTYGITALIWRTLKVSLRDAWIDKSEELRIVLPGGGSVSVKSAVNYDQGLRGAGLDGVVIDEAAFVKEEAWTAALRPALADRQGWGIFISTPAGENWFYDLYKRAESLPQWESFQSPTWANPVIPKSEIEEAKLSMSSNYFRQEFGAEFVAPGAGMFQRDWFQVVDSPPLQARRVRFWDLAATEKKKMDSTKAIMAEEDPDWTAGAKMSVTHQGEWFIEDMERLQGTPLSVERRVVQTAHMDGKAVPIYIEQEPGASGKSVVDYYVRHPALRGFTVRGYKPSGKKEVRAEPVSAQAEHGNIRIVRGNWNRDFLDEVHIFPGGQHDDQVDAVSGAFDCLAQGSFAIPIAPVAMGRDVSPWVLN